MRNAWWATSFIRCCSSFARQDQRDATGIAGLAEASEELPRRFPIRYHQPWSSLSWSAYLRVCAETGARNEVILINLMQVPRPLSCPSFLQLETFYLDRDLCMLSTEDVVILVKSQRLLTTFDSLPTYPGYFSTIVGASFI